MPHDTMNSGCRHDRFHVHGPRRRKCADCGTTWTIRARKRGRKPRKHRIATIERTFVHWSTLVERAAVARVDAGTWRRRHDRQLRTFAARPWPHRAPRGDLILICDALWHTVDGAPWTTYLLGLRSVGGEGLVFLRPILKPGHESQERWREIISAISERTRCRIRAMVADSFSGVEAIVEEHEWVLQRCQFHLLGKLATLCGNRKRSIAWWEGRQRTQALIRQILSDVDEERVRERWRELMDLSNDPHCPIRIRRLIRFTIRWLHEYRACFHHPHLRLPATTNAIENMNGRIRQLLNRHRGLCTPESLERWVVAYVWFHPRMKCRPKIPQ